MDRNSSKPKRQRCRRRDPAALRRRDQVFVANIKALSNHERRDGGAVGLVVRVKPPVGAPLRYERWAQWGSKRGGVPSSRCNDYIRESF